MSVWRKWLTRHPLKVKIAGSNPATDTRALAGVRARRDYPSSRNTEVLTLPSPEANAGDVGRYASCLGSACV